MSNTSNDWDEETEDDFSILDYLYKFLRYWYLFIIAVAIALGVAYVYLKRYTPIYRVTAELLLKDERTQPRSNEVMEQFDMLGGRNIDNEIQVLKSRPILEKVVKDLGIQVSYFYESKSRDKEVYTNSRVRVDATEISSGMPFYVLPKGNKDYELWDADSKYIGTYEYSQKIIHTSGTFRVFKRDSVNVSAAEELRPIKIVLVGLDNAVNSLLSNVSIGLLNDRTSVLSLSIEDAVPQKGKDILQKLLDEYAFNTLEDKNREATSTLRFIEERLNIVTEELGTVEQDVEQYQRQKGITDLSAEASLFLDRLQSNDIKLNEIDINLKVLDEIGGYIKSNQTDNVAPSMLGVSDPTLNGYISQLSKLNMDKTQLNQTVPEGNPLMETMNFQIRNVKLAIRENISNQKSNLLVTKNSITALNNRIEGSMSTIPRKEREFLDIKRQAGVKESLYLMLLKKREETALSYASTITDSRLVNPPYVNPGYIRPNAKKVYTYALALALLIPALFIFVNESLKTTVQSKKELEQTTGLKVFGEISLQPQSVNNQIVDLASRSFISEQIRILRSNLQYLFTNREEKEGKVLLVTSTTTGEGKSFVALNLAHSLTLLGKTVVLVGLDLRKPRIYDYLNVKNKIGVSTYLINKATAMEIVQETIIPSLFIAPSGPIPPNPAELIANGRVESLINHYKKNIDYVVIDTAPMALVTDTSLLASLTDVTFYVVRHEVTPKLHTNFIKDLDKKNIFKSLHLIFNAVNYKNSAEYGYGYGYGYYGTPEKKTFLQKVKGIFRR
jgi:capsular exopolysaccharide synthesis family protein